MLAGPDIRDPFSLPALVSGELDLPGADDTRWLADLRIGWSPSPTGTPVDPAVADAARRTLELLRPPGVRIEQRVETVPTPHAAIRCLLAGDSLLVFVLAEMASPWRSLLLRVLGWFNERYRFSPSFAPMARRG